MFKFIILFFTTYLFGFNSNQISTTLESIKTPTINKVVQKGLTGYIIHNNMIIGKVISIGDKKVKFLPFTKLKNNALATPKIFPHKGDKIIFGLYNFRGLIIAPNYKFYSKIKKKYPNISFISSDIFAASFSTKPTKKDFKNFCQDFNIGIVDFVLDKEYIVDCDSFIILKTNSIKPMRYKRVFFTNYSNIKKDLFSSTPNNWIKYYKSMLQK